MPTPHWRLILNDKAACNEPLRAAVMTMRERDIAVDVRVSWEGADTTRYVTEAITDGVDTLIAAGGDGTLSRVAAALAQRSEDADTLPSLGLVALGTANDFAAAARIPMEPLAALELIHAQRAQVIDLLKVEADSQINWCANLASGGFGTGVTVDTNEGLKQVLGGLAYLVTGMAKLGGITAIAAQVSGSTADGQAFEWRGDFIALGIGNGRQAGGGQALCPDALIDDGLLDLTIVPSLDGELGSTLVMLIREGRHAALDRVAECRRLAWVVIEAAQPFTLNLDGEPLESSRFRIECVAGRVRMHLPQACPLLQTSPDTGIGHYRTDPLL